MGLNTTVVILNDAVPYIERDPKFGERLAAAIQSFDGRQQFVSAGHFGNAAILVEMHHADDSVDVRVGGNTGFVLPPPSKPLQVGHGRVRPGGNKRPR